MLDQIQQSQMLAEKSPNALDWAQFAPMSLMNLNELDESNLLEMLQALTKRRDELRLVDKQLFDLMAECFVRLKPAASFGAGATGANSCSDSSSGFGDGAASSAGSLDDGAIDLTSRLAEVEAVKSTRLLAEQPDGQQQREQAHPAGSKRANLTSPSLHFKKQRLLSAIISTDDIGEKQQVLAEKELDVRNDEAGGTYREGLPGGQAASLKLIACNASSYQQANNQSPIEFQHQQQVQYQQQQLQFHPPAQSSLVVTAAAAASASAGVLQTRRRFEQQFDSGNASSASDQDDDDGHSQTDGSERPQLKKFCSIGTAEMSFERFTRQQHLIDSTLATLTSAAGPQQQQQLTAPASLHNELCARFKPNCYSLELGAGLGNKCQPTGPAALVAPMMMMMPSVQLPAQLAPTAGHSLIQPSHQHHHHLQHHHQHQNQPQADLMHRLYDQFLQKSSASFMGAGQQHLLEAASLHQQQALVPLALNPNSNHFGPTSVLERAHCTATTGKALEVVAPSSGASSSSSTSSLAFERLLVSAKELAPIVRKMSFQCHVCGSCFEDRHRLQQHLSIHLNLHPSWFEERTIKETMAQYELRRGDYLCQACQLRFDGTGEFDKHMHEHGEKPHQCELCSQDNKFVSFRYFRQLLTHLRTHCYIYSCRFVPECRQTANRKDYLKLHILKHHLNNKLPEQYTLCCHLRPAPPPSGAPQEGATAR